MEDNINEYYNIPEGVNDQMTEEQFFFELFDSMSEDVISDEYYNKNSELLSVISGTLFDINQRSGGMPPAMARRVLEGIFSNILKIGLR
jgi:hypothetical protein